MNLRCWTLQKVWKHKLEPLDDQGQLSPTGMKWCGKVPVPYINGLPMYRVLFISIYQELLSICIMVGDNTGLNLASPAPFLCSLSSLPVWVYFSYRFLSLRHQYIKEPMEFRSPGCSYFFFFQCFVNFLVSILYICLVLISSQAPF